MLYISGNLAIVQELPPKEQSDQTDAGSNIQMSDSASVTPYERSEANEGSSAYQNVRAKFESQLLNKARCGDLAPACS